MFETVVGAMVSMTLLFEVCAVVMHLCLKLQHARELVEYKKKEKREEEEDEEEEVKELHEEIQVLIFEKSELSKQVKEEEKQVKGEEEKDEEMRRRKRRKVKMGLGVQPPRHVPQLRVSKKQQQPQKTQPQQPLHRRKNNQRTRRLTSKKRIPRQSLEKVMKKVKMTRRKKMKMRMKVARKKERKERKERRKGRMELRKAARRRLQCLFLHRCWLRLVLQQGLWACTSVFGRTRKVARTEETPKYRVLRHGERSQTTLFRLVVGRAKVRSTTMPIPAQVARIFPVGRVIAQVARIATQNNTGKNSDQWQQWWEAQWGAGSSGDRWWQPDPWPRSKAGEQIKDGIKVGSSQK